MAAKWQQWMPLHIDRWRGSPAVRAMHPAARSGYLELLITQWQTEDCSLSSDPLDLAEASGLGDLLWCEHGPRIMRNFEVLPDGRIRNRACFEEWQEAKRVFEARQSSANRTNTARWAIVDRSVTDQRPNRSAHTITGTVTVTETEKTNTKAKTVAVAPASEILPNCVDPQLWSDWVVMRKKQKAPFTERARAGIVSDLFRLDSFGVDVNSRLLEAIKRGWRGVLFESDKPTVPLERPKTRYELDVERQRQDRLAAQREAGLLQ